MKKEYGIRVGLVVHLQHFLKRCLLEQRNYTLVTLHNVQTLISWLKDELQHTSPEQDTVPLGIQAAKFVWSLLHAARFNLICFGRIQRFNASAMIDIQKVDLYLDGGVRMYFRLWEDLNYVKHFKEYYRNTLTMLDKHLEEYESN